MNTKRTKKKNFLKRGDASAVTKVNLSPIKTIEEYVYSLYNRFFRVHRKSCTQMALRYIGGLLNCEKGHDNMERMVEKDDGASYKQYVHFLSASPWSSKEIDAVTQKAASIALCEQSKRSKVPTAMTVDESSFLKKGNKSVGVKRQYAGTVGKVDNCQVAVYLSLSNEHLCTLVSAELFLPEEWANDKKRCETAGIPEECQVHKTKPQIALSLIKDAITQGTEFDFINGDGLYGHNSELTRGLDELDVLYVLDIHKDETIYLEEPTISIPPKSSLKGRTPSNLQANIQGISVQKYCNSLLDVDFTKERLRKTTKGWKEPDVHTVDVWHWDGKEEKAKRRTLIITRDEKTKFSFSNKPKETYSNNEWAYFQCSRYWVERCFDDCKNELGMSGYQVRGWLAWHHHMSLVMMASLYIMQMKMQNQEDLPLLSVRDARILVIAKLFGTDELVERCLKQMNIRHINRQKDIDRHYKE